MRIAHFPSTFLPTIGGAEIATHNLALRQYQAGHQPIVIQPWTLWRIVRSAVPYKLIPLFPKSLTYTLRARQRGYDTRWLVGIQLAFYQRAYDFDVWHVHGAHPAGFAAIPTLKRMRLPAVATCHGVDIQKLPEIGYGLRLDAAMEEDITETLSAFDRVTAISDSIRSEFVSIGIAPERICDIPNGVEVSRIKSLQVDRNKVRGRMGWPLDETILLTVGRNHSKKGYKFIPEIIKQAVTVRQDFLWVIVGRGIQPIAEMAEKLGIGDRLHVVAQIGQEDIDTDRQTFSLPTDELIKIYKAADIFACPSVLEGLPLVLIEAMAAGLPIVTTDAPGCRDVVEHGVTGLISPVGDTSGMAQNILRLLADPSLAARLGRNGESRSAEYEWSNVVSHYLAVYEELISAPSLGTVSTIE